ncbi:MAG: FkbM family methyltransferase, partial [Verrucomicrobiaceae bacterium]
SQQLTKIHVLKTDCQGFDLEVLRGAETLLRNGAIQILCCEVLLTKQYHQQAYFDDIYRYLRDLGYNLLNLYQPFRRADGTIRWADAVFVHRDSGSFPLQA